MMVSLLGAVLSTAILMLIFMVTLYSFKDRLWVQGMAIMGVIPITGVMTGVLAYDFIKISQVGLSLMTTILLVVVRNI